MIKKMVLFVLLLPVAALGSLSAEGVIDNINAQLRNRATAKAALFLEKDGKKMDEKVMDILMEVKAGREIMKAEILEPPRKRGTVTVTWEGGKIRVEHIEKRPGKRKERKLSVSPQNALLGTGFSYEDMRVLEGPGFGYEWKGEGTIMALPKGDSQYKRKELSVRKMDGDWVITEVRFFGNGGKLLKTQLNEGFVKAYGGWRPTKIEVSKPESSYITVLELDWSGRTVFDF
jgi:hypothetical protein